MTKADMKRATEFLQARMEHDEFDPRLASFGVLEYVIQELVEGDLAKDLKDTQGMEDFLGRRAAEKLILQKVALEKSLAEVVAKLEENR